MQNKCGKNLVPLWLDTPTSQDQSFFYPRCFLVLILKMVFAPQLAPALRVQHDVPSLQRFCSVWRVGSTGATMMGLPYTLLKMGEILLSKCALTQFDLKVWFIAPNCEHNPRNYWTFWPQCECDWSETLIDVIVYLSLMCPIIVL